jgi:hypothetical protein
MPGNPINGCVYFFVDGVRIDQAAKQGRLHR